MAQQQRQQQRGNSQAVAKRPGQTEELSKATGFRAEQVSPFVTTFQGEGGIPKPYINAAGRRYKMDDRFGAGGYEIHTDLPSPDEYRMLREMLGVRDAPFIAIKCEIWVDGRMLARDWGTATPGNILGGATNFEKRGLEICATRAINRAEGQLIASGFSDDNNRYIPASGSPQAAFLRECGELKKALGEGAYYEILGNYGITKANKTDLCTDTEMMDQILRSLRIEAADRAGDALFDRPPTQDAGAAQDVPAEAIDATDAEAEDVPDEDPIEQPPEPPKPAKGESGPQFLNDAGINSLIRFAAQFGYSGDAAFRGAIGAAIGKSDPAELTTEDVVAVKRWVQDNRPD